MKYDFLLVWGIFRKFPVQAKSSLFPYACCVHAKGGRESFLFFQRLAALCMVLLRRFKILLGLWISGTWCKILTAIPPILRQISKIEEIGKSMANQWPGQFLFITFGLTPFPLLLQWYHFFPKGHPPTFITFLHLLTYPLPIPLSPNSDANNGQSLKRHSISRNHFHRVGCHDAESYSVRQGNSHWKNLGDPSLLPTIGCKKYHVKSSIHWDVISYRFSNDLVFCPPVDCQVIIRSIVLYATQDVKSSIVGYSLFDFFCQLCCSCAHWVVFECGTNYMQYFLHFKVTSTLSQLCCTCVHWDVFEFGIKYMQLFFGHFKVTSLNYQDVWEPELIEKYLPRSGKFVHVSMA